VYESKLVVFGLNGKRVSVNLSKPIPMKYRLIPNSAIAGSPGALLNDSLIFVHDFGEWGGGSTTINIETGIVRSARGRSYTGIAAAPSPSECVAISMGVSHKRPGNGQIRTICSPAELWPNAPNRMPKSREVLMPLGKPQKPQPKTAENSDKPENNGNPPPPADEKLNADNNNEIAPTGKVLLNLRRNPFYGIVESEGRLFFSGVGGIYILSPNGQYELVPLPDFEKFGAVFASFEHPDFVLILTDVNRRRSVSNPNPIILFRE
jgi:hypothetical protein